MDIKNFIKKRLEKDDTRFLVRIYENKSLYHSKWFSLTSLSKYLETNKNKIERIDINFLISNKEVN